MKCVICKHGETSKGFASVTLERKNTTLVFKNVPAEICNNCGEEYIDEKVTRSLLENMDEAAKKGVQVDVRQYLVA